MHTAIKGVVGSIGGGGYAVNYLLASNELADKLIQKGYTILPSDSEHWKTILTSYKTVVTADNKLRFGTFAGTGNKAEEELSKYCQNLLKPHTSENIKDPDNYKKAEKWCVTPVTVKDILKHEKYVPINIDTSNNQIAKNSAWEAKVKLHKKSNTKINNLGLSTDENTVTEEDIRKIKEKCTEIGGKKNHEAEYETNLEHFKNWCSNKSN
ncbi:hypothetical protein A6V39_00440 [Candidatus Mycoplasma haematobovis]|uniref:Uncharacterized protein n=1 Tax=Candidatus Mycoplasma haematobovis TaxID=432608 RepID=A0A1A9QE51_9MOLU|nr:hypothetical protein [Candidatus Mycoplasma haematobovis]OAL10518.1 hypothetical protein A6V39_00440 [Candidatus Mycoplasma haematobovis]